MIHVNTIVANVIIGATTLNQTSFARTFHWPVVAVGWLRSREWDPVLREAEDQPVQEETTPVYQVPSTGK